MTENEQLLELQAQYKNGDNAALSVMYKKLFVIAYKTINKKTHKNKNIARLTPIERQHKAEDASTYIIEQYLKRPDFFIKDSMTGYLYRRLSYELYGRGHQRKCDKIVRYTDRLPEPKQNKKDFCYLVKNTEDGTTATYKTAAELFLNPDFKYLRKCELVEAIRTGREWRKYKFDILEVNE